MEAYEKGRNAAIATIVIGLIIFVFGMFGLGWFTFEETKSIEYGGDAYTGIQNAAADTANNVAKACGVLCSVLGFLTSLIGGLLLHYFDIKKIEIKEADRRHKEMLFALNGNTDIK